MSSWFGRGAPTMDAGNIAKKPRHDERRAMHQNTKPNIRLGIVGLNAVSIPLIESLVECCQESTDLKLELHCYKLDEQVNHAYASLLNDTTGAGVNKIVYDDALVPDALLTKQLESLRMNLYSSAMRSGCTTKLTSEEARLNKLAKRDAAAKKSWVGKKVQNMLQETRGKLPSSMIKMMNKVATSTVSENMKLTSEENIKRYGKRYQEMLELLIVEQTKHLHGLLNKGSQTVSSDTFPLQEHRSSRTQNPGRGVCLYEASNLEGFLAALGGKEHWSSEVVKCIFFCAEGEVLTVSNRKVLKCLDDLVRRTQAQTFFLPSCPVRAWRRDFPHLCKENTTFVYQPLYTMHLSDKGLEELGCAKKELTTRLDLRKLKSGLLQSAGKEASDKVLTRVPSLKYGIQSIGTNDTTIRYFKSVEEPFLLLGGNAFVKENGEHDWEAQGLHNGFTKLGLLVVVGDTNLHPKVLTTDIVGSVSYSACVQLTFDLFRNSQFCHVLLPLQLYLSTMGLPVDLMVNCGSYDLKTLQGAMMELVISGLLCYDRNEDHMKDNSQVHKYIANLQKFLLTPNGVEGMLIALVELQGGKTFLKSGLHISFEGQKKFLQHRANLAKCVSKKKQLREMPGVTKSVENCENLLKVSMASAKQIIAANVPVMVETEAIPSWVTPELWKAEIKKRLARLYANNNTSQQVQNVNMPAVHLNAAERKSCFGKLIKTKHEEVLKNKALCAEVKNKYGIGTGNTTMSLEQAMLHHAGVELWYDENIKQKAAGKPAVVQTPPAVIRYLK